MVKRKGERNRTLEDLGFAAWSTGGGCEALRKDIGKERYILLTNPGDPVIPEASGPFLLGLYGADESQIEALTLRTVEEVDKYLENIRK